MHPYKFVVVIHFQRFVKEDGVERTKHGSFAIPLIHRENAGFAVNEWVRKQKLNFSDCDYSYEVVPLTGE